MMYFLRAYKQNGELVVLHVRGFSNQSTIGMINGEGIFEVKVTGNASMHVVRQVGVVQFNENHLSFNYTDENFKKSIAYCNETGYSSIDGGLWEIRKTAYIDSDGKTSNQLNPISYAYFMYSGAKNPLMKLPNLATFFAPENVKTKNCESQQENDQSNKNFSELNASFDKPSY